MLWNHFSISFTLLQPERTSISDYHHPEFQQNRWLSPPTHTPNSFAGRTPKIKLSFFHLILFWASHVREIWLFSSSSPIDVEYKNKLEEKWITFSNFFLVSFFLLSEFTSQCERSSSMGKNVLFCRFLFTWFNFSSSAWLVAFAFHRLFILFFFHFSLLLLSHWRNEID